VIASAKVKGFYVTAKSFSDFFRTFAKIGAKCQLVWRMLSGFTFHWLARTNKNATHSGWRFI